MIKLLRIGGPTIISVAPFKFVEDHDKPLKDLHKPPESGFDRVKKIFTINEYGLPSAELQTIINLTFCGLTLGSIYGGWENSKFATQEFIDENQATKFRTMADARAKLQYYQITKFGIGAKRLGIKIGMFLGIFSTVTTISAAYKGKHTVMDYVCGGATAGFTYKFPLGLRAALTGGIVGGILAGIGGAMMILSYTLSGVSFEDIQNHQLEILKALRKKRIVSAEKEFDMREPTTRDLFEFTQQYKNMEQQLYETDTQTHKILNEPSK